MIKPKTLIENRPQTYKGTMTPSYSIMDQTVIIWTFLHDDPGEVIMLHKLSATQGALRCLKNAATNFNRFPSLRYATAVCN